MKQSVMIATPTADSRVFAQFASALVESQAALSRAGISLQVVLEIQSSLIMSARNKLLAIFLETTHTDLVFIDSDLSWQAKDLLRILTHQVPFVAATYRAKTAAPVFTCTFVDPERVQSNGRSGLLEASEVGAGFLQLRRDGIRAMTERSLTCATT